MFIEKLKPIDLGEPIYGRKTIGCAPKGAIKSKLGLPFSINISPLRGFSVTQLKQGVNERSRPTNSWRTKSLLVLLNLTMLTACQNALSGAQKPVPAGNLAEEYERSSAAVRRKYDGKEIVVRGYTLTAATLPHEGHDQGSVWLEEKGPGRSRQVACWFSRDQAEQFSQIKGAQYITVKGIFNGEAGADLKFCKLVGIE